MKHRYRLYPPLAEEIPRLNVTVLEIGKNSLQPLAEALPQLVFRSIEERVTGNGVLGQIHQMMAGSFLLGNQVGHFDDSGKGQVLIGEVEDVKRAKLPFQQ